MSMADEAYRACQNAARAQAQATGKPVATDAVLTRHALESFLHRLTLTEHADSFVLKGGVLLAAYDYRRTTRDVDSNAVAVDLTAGHVEQITRWRDYVDIVQLCSRGFDSNELRRSAAAVAQYRQVTLGPVGPHLADYDDSGQRRWAAWRRKEDHEDDSDESLEAQLAFVARYLDPVFERDRT